MSEPNPYQPPRENEPLTAPQVVKRGIGFAVILILTPVATFAAFFASCTGAFLTAMTVDSIPEPLIWTLVIGPPAAVFAGMIYWAVRAWKRQRLLREQMERGQP